MDDIINIVGWNWRNNIQDKPGFMINFFYSIVSYHRNNIKFSFERKK